MGDYSPRTQPNTGASQQVACGPIPGFVAAPGDCDDANASAWEIPGEAGELALLPDRQTIIWSGPPTLGGTSVRFDTMRSDAPDTFGLCVERDGEDTMSVDLATPSDGALFFYLVRAGNGCGQGSLGRTSSGIDRAGGACP